MIQTSVAKVDCYGQPAILHVAHQLTLRTSSTLTRHPTIFLAYFLDRCRGTSPTLPSPACLRFFTLTRVPTSWIMLELLSKLNTHSPRGLTMRRREFIWLLCSAATLWPRLAIGQASSKRPLVAWISGGERTASWTFVEAFLQGMREFGYIEGQQFDFTPRFADGYVERLPALADEIISFKPSVIIAPGSGPAVAARKATATIPIVAPALADAVHLGLIASESRPGGNVTGISPYVAGLPAKQLELAREIVPGTGSIGVLGNLADAKAPPQLQELKGAGLESGIKVVAEDANTPDDLQRAIEKLAGQHIDVMVVLQTSMLLSERKRIAALAAAGAATDSLRISSARG
jgi:ABC-type uncharacterized transport system substrate-binding protein